MTKKKLIVSLATVFFSTYLFTNEILAELPVIEIFGTKFQIYKVGKGETAFGISRENNWNDSILEKFNSSSISSLKKGNILFYPVTDDSVSATFYSDNILNSAERLNLNDRPKDELPKVNELFYTIKFGDSFNSVAKEHNVSISSIFNLNPGLQPTGLNPGDSIKMPEWGSGIQLLHQKKEQKYIDNFISYTLNDNESWESLAVLCNTDVSLLLETNPDIKTPKKNTTIYVPVFKSYESVDLIPTRDEREKSILGIRNIYEETNGLIDSDTIPTLRFAILTDSVSSKKDIEFIRGFLQGIKKTRTNNAKISMKVIDGKLIAGEEIDTLDKYSPTMIFNISETGVPEFINEYAISHKTPVVNVFDIKNKQYIENPYLIQINPTAEYFNEIVSKYIHEKFGDLKLVLVGEEDPNDLLASMLKKLWLPEDIRYLPTSSFEAFIDTPSDQVIFYSYSTKKDDIKEFLTNVANLKSKNPEARYQILGRPNWMLFSNSLDNEFHENNVSIPTRFHINEHSTLCEQFYANYGDLFKTKPQPSFPLYAATGYDVSTYFIQSLIKAAKDINKLTPSKKKLQSSFNLKRINNWSGFVNTPVYVIDYLPEAIEECIIL